MCYRLETDALLCVRQVVEGLLKILENQSVSQIRALLAQALEDLAVAAADVDNSHLVRMQHAGLGSKQVRGQCDQRYYVRQAYTSQSQLASCGSLPRCSQNSQARESRAPSDENVTVAILIVSLG